MNHQFIEQKKMLKKLYHFSMRKNRIEVANTVLRFLRGEKFNSLDYEFLKFFLGWVYPSNLVRELFSNEFLAYNNKRRS
jgi:hypothetical protein